MQQETAAILFGIVISPKGKEMETTQNTTIVNTTNGSEIPTGKVMISANLRDTKTEKVAPENRYRNIVIPEFSLPVEDKFRKVLTDKMYEIAKERFEQEMEETNRMGKMVSLSDYTVENLLRWYAETAVSGRLSKETVFQWFDTSTIHAALKAKNKPETEVKKWRELFGKLASPNHGINPNTCRVMLAAMQSEDLETEIGSSLANKLNTVLERDTASLIDSL